MLTSGQLRAARALLNWRQEDLSRAAKVGIATIQRMEKEDGPITGNISTALKIQAAFEKAGISFLEVDQMGGIGVRLSRNRSKD
jgi:DNA-binding XRE family transcriptional regulator